MVEETMIPVDKLTTTIPKSNANCEMIVNRSYFSVACMINPLPREPAKPPKTLICSQRSACEADCPRPVDTAKDKKSR